MATVKISALTAASALSGTEVAPVVQSGTTKKATMAQIRTYTNAGIPNGSDSVKGIVQVDGTTITATGGVITAVGGGGGPSPANPTATASDTAVNGSASTFMRSDAAPAIQLGSSVNFGLVKVDNSTITASGGVISAVGGGGGPSAGNPTATAGAAAINGVAGTFMRSDAAPAISQGSSSVKGIVQVDGTNITASSGVINVSTGLQTWGSIAPGTNVTTFITTPNSSNLAAAITDETGTGSLVFATSPTLVTPILGTPTSGNLDNCTADGTNDVGYRNLPANAKTGSYTLLATDVGKYIPITTGGVTAPNSVFASGDTVTIYNNSGSNQTITQGSGVTMYLVGTSTTGNRTLAQRGLCTIVYTSSSTAVITGGGLT